MNKNIKFHFALSKLRLKGTVVVMCMMCALLFMVAGCGKQVDNPCEDLTPQVKEYYYYNGIEIDNKDPLLLNTKYAFLYAKEPQLPVDIIQRGIQASEFTKTNLERYQYKGVPGISRFRTELTFEDDLTDEQYLKLLMEIKCKNNDVIVTPCYYRENEYSDNFYYIHKLNLTILFSVLLYDEKDAPLLEEMADQMGCVIYYQEDFMPNMFRLNVTESLEMNALECANYFQESGLFIAARPEFVRSEVVNPNYEKIITFK